MLLVVAAVLLAVNPVHAQESIVVERSRVGSVQIDADAANVYSEFGTRANLIDLKLEGQLSPALEIRMFESQLVASMIAEIGPRDRRFIVTRIHVLDPALRTREGIGVGSTYAELRSRYHVAWVGSGEGSFIARVEELAISFALDLSRPVELKSGPRPLWTIRDPDQVPGDVRVVSMMLTR